ncbi:MAG TPA: polysaccharide lyase [Solirubrobacterales bacterium]|nr:polysaccharide lyase [Solirubrobacterales bacterium]
MRVSTVKAPLLFAFLVAAAALLLIGPGAAKASPLDVEVIQSTATEHDPKVGLHIEGARRAREVALYVDGDLRRRDRSWPWGFGRDGRIQLKAGRHEIAVAARFRETRQIRRETVFVRNRRVERSRRNKQASIGISANKPLKKAPRTPVPLPPATDLWHGDFETGDISQWDMVQQVASDRITIAQDPKRQGNYAARFEVRPGDNIGDTAPRAELASFLDEEEGEERYYRWFTYFDPNFPTEYEDEFVTFTQWRAEDESDAYTSFMVWGDEIELRRDGTRWSTPLTKGVWHEFIYHVKWSPDPDVGFIELWYDGEHVLAPLNVDTMAGSPGDAVQNYVKQGLYKADEIPTGVVYHDGFVAGPTLEAVQGA